MGWPLISVVEVEMETQTPTIRLVLLEGFATARCIHTMTLPASALPAEVHAPVQVVVHAER